MADIDLIPASWRAEQRARRVVAVGLVAAGCAIVGVAIGRIGLELAIRHDDASLNAQHVQRRDSERTAARLTALSARLDEARTLQTRIATQRGGHVVEGVLLPVDQALTDQIWFDELIVAQQAAPPQTGAPQPQPEAALTLRGKAPDAAAIGDFAERLSHSGRCAKPRLVPGTVKRYTRLELLEFSLSCPVPPQQGGGA